MRNPGLSRRPGEGRLRHDVIIDALNTASAFSSVFEVSAEVMEEALRQNVFAHCCQCAVSPPSTTMLVPVTQLASSDRVSCRSLKRRIFATANVSVVTHGIRGCEQMMPAAVVVRLLARLQCARDRYSDIAADERFPEHIDDLSSLRSFAQERTAVTAH